MKNIIRCAFAGILLLAACSKKDDVQANASINGKWSITADTVKHYESGHLLTANAIVGINSPYYLFNADGTGTFKNNGGLPDDIRHFKYTVSEKSITFVTTNPDQSIYNASGIIKKLTANDLTILFIGNNTDFQEIMYLKR